MSTQQQWQFEDVEVFRFYGLVKLAWEREHDITRAGSLKYEEEGWVR